MTLAPGTILGRYEIRSLVGAGGMGEVYRARDPKIGRDVAVKVLPAAFSGDKDRLARFEQEAQAAGALNHPNILAIYDVDSVDGNAYVVSELLEGETLREVMGGAPMAVRKALNYAMQVSHGLAAAHEKGIVHRDLKPENLFVTNDGRVKILDFGLAKLLEPAAGAASHLPTRQINTDAGAVMGTVGYMSPEQLRGSPVDPRTDIFSFGTVLYEMLSGQKAFQKDSTADTISSILREDPPDLSTTNQSVDAGLERVVRRCLEKNREERFHSASDLAFALDSLTTVASTSEGATRVLTRDLPGVTPLRTRWGTFAWIAAALLLLTSAGLLWAYLKKADQPAATVRFDIKPAAKSSFAEFCEISPDGRQIAVIEISADGTVRLAVRAIDSLEMKPLPDTAGAMQPFWSPDSRFIGFFAAGKLKKIDVAGGPPQTLTDVTSDPRGGAWGADGTIIFSPGTTSPLMKVAASGGPAAQVTDLDPARGQTSHRWPQFLPDKRSFLFFARGGKADMQGIYTGSLDSRDAKFLMTATIRGIFAPKMPGAGAGHLLFMRGQVLMAQPFDPVALELSGEPVAVADEVLNFPDEAGPTAFASYSISENGRLVYKPGIKRTTQLVWTDRSGKPLGELAQRGFLAEPFFSPDGKKFAVNLQNDGAQDIWIFEIERNSFTRFTFDPSPDVCPLWSPDGSRVVFSSNRDGKKFSLYQKVASGAGSEELLLDAGADLYADDWSRDGKYIIYEMIAGPDTKVDLWLLPTFGDGKPTPYLQTPFVESHAQFSPDGRWVAYASEESGRPEIFVQSFPIGGGKWQISTTGGDQPQWSRDGKQLYYIAADKSLMAVPVTMSPTFDRGTPAVLFPTRVPATSVTDDRNNYAPSPDGQRFLVNNLNEDGSSSPIVVVLNWETDVKK